MNYGLTNRLLVRKDAEGQPQAGAPRELLNVSVRQSYYTDANASKFDTVVYLRLRQSRPQRFSPVSLTARATPTSAAGDRLPRGIRPGAGERDAPKLLGMSLNGTLRSPLAEVSAGWSRQAYASVDRVDPRRAT